MTNQWRKTDGSPNGAPDGSTGTLAINKEQLEALDLVLNKVNSRVDYICNAARSMTKEMRSRLTDRRRDYEKECGHPEPSELDADYYQRLYERDPIAARVIEVWPKETWRRSPQVYEGVSEKLLVNTPFEKSLLNLCKDLNGSTGYGGETGWALWRILEELDVQCGIGRYGVLYIAIDDNMDPRYPVQGWKIPDGNTDYGGVADETYPYEPANGPPSAYGSSYSTPSAPIAAYTSPQRTPDGNTKLLYLQVYPESMAKVVKWERRPNHKRYGQPIQYELNCGVPNEGDNSDNPPQAGLVVHWSRVVHVADNTSSNKVLGTPRCQQVVNRILDLKKLYGGSAEMYWLGALPAIIFKSDPALGGDVDLNLSVLKDQIERLMNGLQRHAVLNGMDAEGLAPTVVDPRPQIEVQLEAICIKIKVPLRIFKGSERGELSSAQDSVQHSKEIRGRDDRFATPSIVCAVISRFIDLELLTPPGDGGYKVWWPDPDNESPQEKATVAVTLIQAISEYIKGGVDQYVPAAYLLTQFLGGMFTRQEADVMLKEAKKEYQAKQDKEQAIQDQQATQAHQRQLELKATAKPTALKPATGGSSGVFSTNSSTDTSDLLTSIKVTYEEIARKIDNLSTIMNSDSTPVHVNIAQPQVVVNNSQPPITVNNEVKVPQQAPPVINMPDMPTPVINNQVIMPDTQPTVVNQINIEPSPVQITDVRLVQDDNNPFQVKVQEDPKPVKEVKIQKDADGKWTGTVEEK